VFSACEIFYDYALYKFTLHYITSVINANAKPSASDIDAARSAPLSDTADTDDLDSLTMSDVLVRTVEELLIELQRRGKIPAGTNKLDLQEALLKAIAEPPTVRTMASVVQSDPNDEEPRSRVRMLSTCQG